MTKSVKTTYLGEKIIATIGMEVFIGKCGSGRSIVGENGKLVKILKNHLVFQAESGYTAKTPLLNSSSTVGQAEKDNVFVSLNGPREEETFMKIVLK